MNALQKVELEILIEIDRICQKHNLKYSLDAGTLLGAVRHKGFIPWDDDIDIIMPIKDFKKFSRICRKELDQKYFLQNAYTDKYNSLYMKVRKNNTAAVEDWSYNLDIHNGIWVDVFPTVGYKGKYFLFFSKKCALIRDWILGDAYFKDNMKKSNTKVYYLTKVISAIPLKIRHIIARFLDLFIYTNTGQSQKFFNVWCISADLGANRLYDRCLFNGYTTLEFEEHNFSCLKNYDKYLRQMFGDYMQLPPVEKRTSGHKIVKLKFDEEHRPNLD